LQLPPHGHLRPVPLASVAQVFGTHGRRVWVALVGNLHGLFADESGTHDQAVGTLLAGYVAPAAVWDDLWKRICRAHINARLGEVLMEPHPHLTKPFHMTAFVTPGHEDYAHLSDGERKRLIQTLVGLIGRSRKTGFAAAVLRQEYEATLRRETKKHIRDPYFFCFQLLLQTVLWWAARSLPRGDQIQVIVEHRRGTEMRGQAAYQEMLTRHDPHGYLMPVCVFMEKKRAPQLVTADLLANCAGRFFKRPGLRMARSDDPVFYRLLKNKRLQHHWRYYDGPMLKEIEDRLIRDGYIVVKDRRL